MRSLGSRGQIMWGFISDDMYEYSWQDEEVLFVLKTVVREKAIFLSGIVNGSRSLLSPIRDGLQPVRRAVFSGMKEDMWKQFVY